MILVFARALYSNEYNEILIFENKVFDILKKWLPTYAPVNNFVFKT